MARPVYSTTDGDLRKARPQQVRDHREAGGRVKVRRETAGRRGKAVTTVSGVPLGDDELKALAGLRVVADLLRARLAQVAVGGRVDGPGHGCRR